MKFSLLVLSIATTFVRASTDGQPEVVKLPGECGNIYKVVTGDGASCAKIEISQGVSEAVLMSPNSGLSCGDIFPGQPPCVTAPSASAPSDPIPTLPPPLPEPVVPSVPCKTEIAVTLGDICYDLATNNGLQLTQFMALNAKINCSNLQPGDIVCVLPACGEIYRVQPNNSCSSIEQNNSLPTGKLVQLNPSLDCNKLVPEQIVCVEDPPAAPTPKASLPDFSAWSEYPVLSPGSTLTRSPVIDFLNAKDPRSSFIGQTMFQLDSQHRKVFSAVDINRDGHINRSEMDTLLNLYPVLLRGMGGINASYSPENITDTTMAALDLNGDGVVDEGEYVFGAYKVQKMVQTAGGGGQSLMRRDLPSLFPPGLLGLSAAQLSYVLSRMKSKADAGGSHLSDYLGIAFWDQAYTPEPQCSSILYVSSSCGGLASNAAARCSEGGNRVFDNSCRDDIGEGAFQCNMNGCSSLCYKINTNGCECDALRYTQENLALYEDRPLLPPATTNNLMECRKKCSSNKSCIGFTVQTNIDGATVRCLLYDTMRNPKMVQYGTVSFRKVPNSNGGDMCPPLTEGYRLSENQFEAVMNAGEKAAEEYANSFALRNDVGRAPDSFDPRTTFKTPPKDQGNTELCVSFTITTMVEASIMTKFKRKTAMELSPLWLAMCKAKQTSLRERNKFTRVRNRLGSDYMATESCVPWSTRESPTCNNGCFKQSYGDLPYLTDSIEFQDALTGAEGVEVWDRMKEHLSTIGPLYSGFQISTGFGRYSQMIASRSEEEVFYDGHPDWPQKDCPYGGHAMTIIGYGHFKKGGKGKDRLYWIVQNSWGISKGRFGYVLIAAGSLGQASETAYGIKVNERITHTEV